MNRTLLPGAICAALFGVLGCAEPVKDIDRTQGNLLQKSELEGEWYVLQTVVKMPPTRAFTFIGETSSLERVRWEVQRDALVAYRSYEKVPGADSPSATRAFDGRDAPVAAWPILAHVDVRRDYNAETGEQTNVIRENQEDRLWHERDYIRVDWSRSLLGNFSFIAPVASVTPRAYFVEGEQGGPDALYAEHSPAEDGAPRLSYFDVTGKYQVEPYIWSCIYDSWGFGVGDCAPAELDIRTSFARVPEAQTYEPFHYDDTMLSRFGYFRTEYFTHDPQRGITDAGRRYLINRHHIWERSLDESGTPIPIDQRTPRTVPYYLNADFPPDPALRAEAAATMAEWNRAARAGVAAAIGRTDFADIFVLCGNPVAEEDPEACGPRGLSPRTGDLRYSTLHWVDEFTQEGLLGYGPAASDPITGENISGKAYVYGGAVSAWASLALDMIRLQNQDLDLETLTYGAHFAERVSGQVKGRDLQPDARLASRPVERRLDERKPPRQRPDVGSLRPFDAKATQRRLNAARATGAVPVHAEVQRAIQRRAAASHERAGPDFEDDDDDDDDDGDPAGWLSPMALKQRDALRRAARARGVDLYDLLSPDLDGLAARYAGRTDYDAVWAELRADLFGAVARHEVGHALGLRHNFAGSYDSLNYGDEYWRLRGERLSPIETLGDFFEQVALSESQSEGLLRQRQYSSIMDYGYGWDSDLQGIGKYDEAALVFGYTAGSRTSTGTRCARYPSVRRDGGCLTNEPGLVEVFRKRSGALGDAGQMLTRTERGMPYDDPVVPAVSLLERYHYTTVALSFPSLDDLSSSGREWLPYGDYLEGRDARDRAVRVPYLFCSDEWESALVSCHAYDRGADPYEVVRARAQDYRASYPFVSFRRDRVDYEIWEPLFAYFYRTFLPLSDLFQSWYVAPYGIDPVFDRSYELAINAGFNLIAEALATPPYGNFCEGRDGQLIHLQEDPVYLQGAAEIDPECLPGGRRVTLAPGEGRRPFSFYDPSVGYNLELKPQEAGHMWTAMAAIWALFDPDALIIGVDGDAGVYSISMYDWFGGEIDRLMGDLLTEDYLKFAPRALPAREGGDGPIPARLRQKPPAPIYDYDTGELFDPETGAAASPRGVAALGSVALCEPCVADAECIGHTGQLGGAYCQPAGDGIFCLVDCTDDEDNCPAGTYCDELGNCVPDNDDCPSSPIACSQSEPRGQCPAGAVCEAGRCAALPWEPVVESEPTFALKTDIFFYGFLLTTAGYSTRFNDYINVFRPGSEATIEGDPLRTEQRTFTHPISGVTYAAVQPRCVADGAGGGALRRLCAPCTADAQCAGFIGQLGGVYCQPLDEAGEGPGYCLQDCTNDPGVCGEGETCDANGNCIPTGGVCPPVPACSPDAPDGLCPAGAACVGGRCEAVFEPSERCRFLRPEDTAGVRLIDQANSLAQRYDAALAAWYGYTGNSETEDNRLARAFFRAEFELTFHVDLLETLLATYAIFGRIY